MRRSAFISHLKSHLRNWKRDKRGNVTMMAAAWISAFAGLTGLTVDAAHVMYTKKMLQNATDAAALAGAYDLYAGNGSTVAITSANTYSATSGNLNADKLYTATMVSGYPKTVCFSSLGTCSSTSPNGVVVEQQATVPLYFSGIFGVNSMTVMATSSASASGGQTGASTTQGPIDIVVILDTTDSMNDNDPACNMSQIACAKQGVQTLLQGLNPCSTALTTCGSATNGSVANPSTQVALMVFPPLSSSSQAEYDYDCSSATNPTTTSYATTTGTYQVLGFQSDYRQSDTATTLNTSSNLVRAVGGGGSGCNSGIAAIGGYGTYYVGVISAAQSLLTNSGRANAKHAIVFLSDGDANAKTENVPTGMGSQECHEAITAADADTTAGTLVYTIAYGALASGCSTDTSPTISPCDTMKEMASDYETKGANSTMFYSYTSTATGAICSGIASNTSSNSLTTIFSGVQSSLTSAATSTGAGPRLVPNSTT